RPHPPGRVAAVRCVPEAIGSWDLTFDLGELVDEVGEFGVRSCGAGDEDMVEVAGIATGGCGEASDDVLGTGLGPEREPLGDPQQRCRAQRVQRTGRSWLRTLSAARPWTVSTAGTITGSRSTAKGPKRRPSTSSRTSVQGISHIPPARNQLGTKSMVDGGGCAASSKVG